MDYGYRMLVHIVRQVFGNLGPAVRLTAFLTFLPMVLGLTVFLSLGITDIDYTTVPQRADSFPDVNVGLVFLYVIGLVVISVITYCWAAVGWHRYVLLEEQGRGITPQWRGENVLSYIGRALIIGVVAVILGFISGLFLSGLLAAASGLAFVILSGWVLGMTWVITRIGLILPAAALGRPMTISESWNATKPVSADILVPLFFIALALTVLGQLNGVVFGQGLIGSLFAGVLYWLQLLLNLSLMTTLYGTQIEGRSLT